MYVGHYVSISVSIAFECYHLLGPVLNRIKLVFYNYWTSRLSDKHVVGEHTK
jgi:hypothetical protein